MSEDNIPCTKSFLFLMSNDLLPNNEFLFKIREVFRKKTILRGNFSHTSGGGLTQTHLFFVCLTSFFCMPKSSWGAKTCFILFKINFSSGKKTIFLTWAFPYWGGGGGVCPRGKNSHVISFFSEDVPYFMRVTGVHADCLDRQSRRGSTFPVRVDRQQHRRWGNY